MPVARLQQLLADIYDADVGLDVRDFIVTERSRATKLAGQPPPASESLLVRETPGGLELALYLDASVLGRLTGKDPFAALELHDLEDLCTALEGISHFQYLVWCAQRGRSVSLLEMETQAEVDKFAATFFLLSRQLGRVPADLHARLFERIRFVEALPAAIRARYETANRLAARFCRRLQRRFLERRGFRPDLALKELRAFWRLPHAPKLNAAAA